MEHNNPFKFGALALDEAFTDRDDELAELGAAMRNGQDVLVYAPRRYGKSSLVLAAAQQAVADGILVGYCDLLRITTKERFAAALAKTIHRDVDSATGQALDLAGEVRALRPRTLRRHRQGNRRRCAEPRPRDDGRPSVRDAGARVRGLAGSAGGIRRAPRGRRGCAREGAPLGAQPPRAALGGCRAGPAPALDGARERADADAVCRRLSRGPRPARLVDASERTRRSRARGDDRTERRRC